MLNIDLKFAIGYRTLIFSMKRGWLDAVFKYINVKNKFNIVIYVSVIHQRFTQMSSPAERNNCTNLSFLETENEENTSQYDTSVLKLQVHINQKKSFHHQEWIKYESEKSVKQITTASSFK